MENLYLMHRLVEQAMLLIGVI